MEPEHVEIHRSCGIIKAPPTSAETLDRGLTHSPDLTREQDDMNDTRICSIEGCERKHCARGLCNTCYARERKRENLDSFPSETVTGCVIEGCGNAHRARGLCHSHYERWLKYGTTDLHVTPQPSPAERLAAGVKRMPNGCLEWTGKTSKGYGSIKINGKSVRVHRLAWELVNGTIPAGLSIRHFVCDNPPCCDVGHLLPGTHAENMADKNNVSQRGLGIQRA